MSDTIAPNATHENSRKQLYSIVSDTNRSLRQKEFDILKLGTEYLDVSLGYITEIETETEQMKVLASTDEEILQDGSSHNLSKTYCRRCVESESGLAVADVIEAGWEGSEAYEKYGLGCYLGVPLYVDGELFGTVCFADEEIREPAFSPTERAFVELTARLIAREKESKRFEGQLEAREADVQEREAELEDSEEKYRALLEAAPDAIFLSDAETHEIVDVNDSAVELTGYTAGDLVGEPIDKVHPSGKACRYAEAFRESITDGGATVAELDSGDPILIERDDGTTVPVEITAAQVEIDGRTCIQGILRDISDRREREQELRLKDRAIEEAPVGITIADAHSDGDTVEDNGLIYGNKRFQQMTGYDWSDVSGYNCRFLQGPDTNVESVDTLRQHIDAEKPVRTELLNYRKDGTPFWNELSVAPIEGESGDASHFVGFQRDITNRKRQEKLVGVLNRVLRHNLRNGMNVVLTRAKLLSDYVEGDGAKHVEAIQKRAEKLVSLGEQASVINQTVTAEAEQEVRDITSLIDDVAADLRSKYPDAEISVETPDSQEVIASDSLSTALCELGTNAIEHSGPEPTVCFDVSATDEHGTVEVEVTDDGPGLPEEERQVLARGYETELEHSSGLGLWFVNWVVTGLGGTVKTKVDDGTAITIALRDPTVEDQERLSRRQSTFRT